MLSYGICGPSLIGRMVYLGEGRKHSRMYVNDNLLVTIPETLLGIGAVVLGIRSEPVVITKANGTV
jgi:hypothetical protein